MGILNLYFGGTESVAREAGLDDEQILKSLEGYIGTIPEKRRVVGALALDPHFSENLQLLKQLVETELVDTANEEKKEKELVSDLELIEHSKKIKRVHRLEQSLFYFQTRYEYIHELLSALYSILRTQLHLIKALTGNAENPEGLIAHLKQQFELEQELINKINRFEIEGEKFHSFFLRLIKGEHIIRRLSAKEGKLIKRMQAGMKRIFANELTEGITFRWTTAVYEAIEEKVHEGVAKGMFPGYHPDIDFEFANRPEFVELVKEKIAGLRQRPVSEEMIRTFVHIFREWYNHERD